MKSPLDVKGLAGAGVDPRRSRADINADRDPALRHVRGTCGMELRPASC